MKDKNVSYAFRQNQHVLQCPICKGIMSVEDSQLLCSNGHAFDLSREGYVNLLGQSIKTEYNKQLYKSRKAIIRTGFFNPLTEVLSKEIKRRSGLKDSLTILDAGCGEGSLFKAAISSAMKTNPGIDAIGMDISKEGIKLAAKEYHDIMWAAADIASLPIADNSIDIIINILSPASYTQFKRVLKNSGTLIKVIPGTNYLKELREMFYKGTNIEEYSNGEVLSLFEKNFRCTENKHIVRTVPFEERNVMDLMRMTPLLWNVDESIKEKVLTVSNVTLDIHILSGQAA